jgi:hypothetical protein
MVPAVSWLHEPPINGIGEILGFQGGDDKEGCVLDFAMRSGVSLAKFQRRSLSAPGQ